jgi:hypothetical protein
MVLSAGTPGDVLMGLGYVAVGLLALQPAGPFAGEDRSSILRSYWWWVGIGLIAIGMARMGAAERGVDRIRDVALREGWYNARAGVQIGALVTLVTFGGIAAILYGQRLDPVARRHAITVGALAVLAGVRAISLHAVDRLLLTEPFGHLTVAHWAEVVALLVAAAISRDHRAG